MLASHARRAGCNGHALSVSASARLVKYRALPLHAGDSNVGYLLQVYCRDAHPMMRGRGEPTWSLVWDGTSSTVEAALHRYRTESLDPSLEVFDAPEEPPVEPPDSNAPSNA